MKLCRFCKERRGEIVALLLIHDRLQRKFKPGELVDPRKWGNCDEGIGLLYCLAGTRTVRAVLVDLEKIPAPLGERDLNRTVISPE